MVRPCRDDDATGLRLPHGDTEGQHPGQRSRWRILSGAQETRGRSPQSSAGCYGSVRQRRILRCQLRPLRTEGKGYADARSRAASGGHTPGSFACSRRQENQHRRRASRADFCRVLLREARDTRHIRARYRFRVAATEHGYAGRFYRYKRPTSLYPFRRSL